MAEYADVGAKLKLRYGGTEVGTQNIADYTAVGECTSSDLGLSAEEIDITPIGQTGTAVYQSIMPGRKSGRLTAELTLDATTSVHSTLLELWHQGGSGWFAFIHPQADTNLTHNVCIRGPILDFNMSGGGSGKYSGTITVGSSGVIVRNQA